MSSAGTKAKPQASSAAHAAASIGDVIGDTIATATVDPLARAGTALYLGVPTGPALLAAFAPSALVVAAGFAAPKQTLGAILGTGAALTKVLGPNGIPLTMPLIGTALGSAYLWGTGAAQPRTIAMVAGAGLGSSAAISYLT